MRRVRREYDYAGCTVLLCEGKRSGRRHGRLAYAALAAEYQKALWLDHKRLSFTKSRRGCTDLPFRRRGAGPRPRGEPTTLARPDRSRALTFPRQTGDAAQGIGSPNFIGQLWNSMHSQSAELACNPLETGLLGGHSSTAKRAITVLAFNAIDNEIGNGKAL